MPRAVPEDHKPAQGTQVEPEVPEGADLLKPFDELPAWVIASLVTVCQPLLEAVKGGQEEGSNEVTFDPATFDFSLLGVAIETVGREAAIDFDAYTRFLSGRQGLARGVALTVWYLSSLGE